MERSHRRLIKARLRPQMKKYLCLWYMSTKNHNILYFVDVSSTYFANKGICLWKALKTLAGHGFPPVKSALNPVQTWECTTASPPKPKPSPCRGRVQDAEMVQMQGVAVGDVEIWSDIRGRGQQERATNEQSLLEVRLVRNHLLVQDAHDQNTVGFQNVKHNVLANLKAA